MYRLLRKDQARSHPAVRMLASMMSSKSKKGRGTGAGSRGRRPPKTLTSIAVCGNGSGPGTASSTLRTPDRERHRKILNANPPLPALDFELPEFCRPCALPDGERLCLRTNNRELRIVDKQMQQLRAIGDEASGVELRGVEGLAASADGLYVAKMKARKPRTANRPGFTRPGAKR